MEGTPAVSLRSHRIAFLAIVVVAAVFDLWSKWEAFERLGAPPSPLHHEVIPRILRFETATNTGVAWGMMGQKSTRWLIVGLSLVAFPVIAVIFVRAKAPSWVFTLGLASIGGGTLGNLYDRLVHGAVRDFIYVYCINFPIFNVADTFICVGAALLAMEQLLVPKPPDTGAAPGTPAPEKSGIAGGGDAKIG
ncbi:MAG: signal peptidase II [Candidatus Brocadiae bacterium]|nr:signal peptidase II [Candidatus Brocadiia bacterium]